MATTELRPRPLGFTEVLDEAFVIYRRNFWLLFGIAFLPHLLANLAQIPLSLTMAEASAMGDFEAIMVSGIGLLGIFVLSWFAAEIASGAMAIAISERFLGRQTSIGACYSRLFARLPAFLGYLVMKGLILITGYLCCFIPMVILYCFLLVSVCVFVIEGQGATNALDRSFRLTNGHAFRAFGLVVVLSVIIFFMVYAWVGLVSLLALVVPALQDPSRPEYLYWQVLQQSISGLATAFAAPVMSGMVVLFYYDLRVRKEAFDLEVLAQNLAARP